MSVYQSILEKRSSDVTLEEIRACEGLNVHAKDMMDIPERLSKLWNYHYPYHPGQVQQVLTAGYEASIQTQMTLDVPPNCALDVVLFFEGRQNSFSRFTFYASMCPNMQGSHIVLPEGLRGKGVGKHYMRNAIEYEIAMGGEKKSFTAGLANGGYTWTSMGAEVEMGNWNGYDCSRNKASLQLQCKLSLIKDHLDADAYDGISELVRINTADSLVRLVDEFRNVTIPLDLKDFVASKEDSLIAPYVIEFHKAHSTFSGYKEMEQEAILNEFDVMQASFQWAKDQGHEAVQVPRFLLSGTVYPARIDYNNAAQMNRIGAYLGGWNTIKPVNDDRLDEKSFRIPEPVNG